MIFCQISYEFFLAIHCVLSLGLDCCLSIRTVNFYHRIDRKVEIWWIFMLKYSENRINRLNCNLSRPIINEKLLSLS